MIREAKSARFISRLDVRMIRFPEWKGTADPGNKLSLGSRFRPPAGTLGSGSLDAGLFQVCGGAGIASSSRAAAGPFARLGQTALETACYAFLSHRFQCGPSFTIHLFAPTDLFSSTFSSSNSVSSRVTRFARAPSKAHRPQRTPGMTADTRFRYAA